MKYLKQYKNLSKDIYVLFFGRIVTSMGALIWPIMTLILKNKLGYSATTIATIDSQQYLYLQGLIYWIRNVFRFCTRE